MWKSRSCKSESESKKEKENWGVTTHFLEIIELKFGKKCHKFFVFYAFLELRLLYFL